MIADQRRAEPGISDRGDSWKAILPGDYARAPKSVKELKKSEVSNLLWPLLSRQLINEHGEIIDQTTVQLGETVFFRFRHIAWTGSRCAIQ